MRTAKYYTECGFAKDASKFMHYLVMDGLNFSYNHEEGCITVFFNVDTDEDERYWRTEMEEHINYGFLHISENPQD